MKADWKKVKLGDFIELHRGYDLTKDSFIKGPYPVVCSTSIMGYHNSYKVKGPGVIIGRSGTLGQVQYIKENYWPHNTSLYVSDFKNNDVLFVRYFLQNIGTDSVGGGSAVPTLNRNHLSILDIVVPPLETQQKIASILSAYDDLIEKNRKQIKLLEEAAQRLYKEWFVDLRFPGYENVAIVDGVPEGWRKDKIGSLLPIVTGKKDANFGTKDGMYPFFTCSQEPIKAPSYSFDANAILLAGNGDLNVKIFRGKFEAYQRTYVLVPNEQEHLFICYRTVQDNLRKLIHGASGSTIKFITKGMIENIDVIIPQDEILIKFNILSDNILKKMEKLQRQIYLSQQARDKLLPRLMSGEMEV